MTIDEIMAGEEKRGNFLFTRCCAHRIPFSQAIVALESAGYEIRVSEVHAQHVTFNISQYPGMQPSSLQSVTWPKKQIDIEDYLSRFR